jgi:hypothetical protein
VESLKVVVVVEGWARGGVKSPVVENHGECNPETEADAARFRVKKVEGEAVELATTVARSVLVPKPVRLVVGGDGDLFKGPFHVGDDVGKVGGVCLEVAFREGDGGGVLARG